MSWLTLEDLQFVVQKATNDCEGENEDWVSSISIWDSLELYRQSLNSYIDYVPRPLCRAHRGVAHVRHSLLSSDSRKFYDKSSY
jgi:hypothetical protein